MGRGEGQRAGEPRVLSCHIRTVLFLDIKGTSINILRTQG